MSIGNQIKGFVDEAQEYVEARIEHTQLQTVDKASSAVSNILGWICILAVVFICVLMISVLGICLLHSATGSYLQAVSIVCGFYLIVAVVMIVFRRKVLTDPIKNKILGLYLNASEDE